MYTGNGRRVAAGMLWRQMCARNGGRVAARMLLGQVRARDSLRISDDVIPEEIALECHPLASSGQGAGIIYNPDGKDKEMPAGLRFFRETLRTRAAN